MRKISKESEFFLDKLEEIKLREKIDVSNEDLFGKEISEDMEKNRPKPAIIEKIAEKLGIKKEEFDTYFQKILKEKCGTRDRRELAVEIDIERITLLSYLRGTRIPSVDNALKIAQYFDLTLNELLIGKYSLEDVEKIVERNLTEQEKEKLIKK